MERTEDNALNEQARNGREWETPAGFDAACWTFGYDNILLLGVFFLATASPICR